MLSTRVIEYYGYESEARDGHTCNGLVDARGCEMGAAAHVDMVEDLLRDGILGSYHGVW